MNVEFTNEQQQFIEQSLASGRYDTEAELLKEALSLLQKQERELADMRSIFAESHERNKHLDVDATQALIETEVQAHRQSSQVKPSKKN